MSHSLIKDASSGVGRDFLLYWKPDSVDDNRVHRPLLRHAGSDQLQRVSVGDTLWISTVRDGGLFVAGRLKIGECTDWGGAKQRLGTDDISEATFHVIAAAGTVELIRNMSMAPIVNEMRFEGANDRFVLSDGKIDPGQLEPMRELAPSSAALVSSLWTHYRAAGKEKTDHGRGALRKSTSNNGSTNHTLTAENILESLGHGLDLVTDATTAAWIAYLNKEAHRVLKESDPELFYTNEGHEYLRAWENLAIPFIVHMRVEIDDRIPNAPPDYGCRRKVDSEVDPATVSRNIVACLQQLCTKDPRDSQTHYNLGLALTYAGRPQEAIEAYQRALTVYPEMIGAHYNLGSTYFAVGEYELAIEQLEETTRLAPEFAQAHFMLGTVLMALGSHSLGIEATKRGLEFSPDNLVAHANIGRAFKELKDYEAAIPWLEKALSVSPGSADAYYEMGRVYNKVGRFEDEFGSYFKALEVQDGYLQALFALGVAYARRKRGAEARVVSKEPPSDLDLQDGETLYYVALAYLALGDLHLVRKWRNSLREIDPRLADDLETYIAEREQGGESETAQTEVELKWSEADQNPFGIRVLDCTGFSASMLSTTADEKTAARFLSLRDSTGVEHRGHSPERVVRFQCRLKYSPLETPEEGALFTASQMEDKWDIYFYDGYLYFVQSWSGLLAYRAWAVFKDGGLVIDVVEADRKDEPKDKTYATRTVDFLIKSHLLRGLVPHPIPSSVKSDPEQIALFSFTNFGRWAQYASYEDTLPCVAHEAFSPQSVQLAGLDGEAVSPDELKVDDTVTLEIEDTDLQALPTTIDLPVTAVAAPADQQAIRVSIGGQEFEAPTIPQLYRQALEFLYNGGYIEKVSLPVASGPKSYLLATSPEHRWGDPFVSPVEYSGYYMEAHNNRFAALSDLERLVTQCGLTFEMEEASESDGNEPIIVAHSSDFASAESGDSGEATEEFNDPVEAVRLDESESFVLTEIPDIAFDEETDLVKATEALANEPDDNDQIAVDHVSAFASADSTDSVEATEEFNDPVEAVPFGESEISMTLEIPDISVVEKTDLVNATEALAKAQKVFVLTGAGVSAESNVPTFEEFKEDRWAQESLARWRETTEAKAPEGPKGGTYTLRSGRSVSLDQLSVSPTYPGQLEGTLETASRHLRRDLSRRVAEAMRPGTPLLIIDDTTTVLGRFQWIALFESSGGVKTDDLDYRSRLYVCWFTDDISDHFNSLIGKVLSSIDWEAKAEDYNWTDL